MHVNFGVESGDDEILRIIKKGVDTAQVLRALEWAKAEGLQTACNFMLGFPQDSPASPERTARFNRFYIDDAHPALDLFHCDSATRAMIRECLRIKGEHNLLHMGLLAAGASA